MGEDLKPRLARFGRAAALATEIARERYPSAIGIATGRPVQSSTIQA